MGPLIKNLQSSSSRTKYETLSFLDVVGLPDDKLNAESSTPFPFSGDFGWMTMLSSPSFRQIQLFSHVPESPSGKPDFTYFYLFHLNTLAYLQLLTITSE